MQSQYPVIFAKDKCEIDFIETFTIIYLFFN